MAHPTLALYRLYDAEGLLLYIGMTGNLTQRLSQHQSDKSWWNEVAAIKVQRWFGNRDELALAELTAIRTEDPRYNIFRGWERPQRTPEVDALLDKYRAAMAEQARVEAELAECSDRRARALTKLHAHGWSFARIAKAVCLSRARVQQLVERGRDVAL